VKNSINRFLRGGKDGVRVHLRTKKTAQGKTRILPFSPKKEGTGGGPKIRLQKGGISRRGGTGSSSTTKCAEREAVKAK